MAEQGAGVREPSTGLVLDERMAARYGVRRTSRLTIGVLALLCALFVAGVLAIAIHLATPATQSKVLAFRVVSDNRVDLTFEVRRDATADTYCVLRARAEDHTDVGYVELRITAGSAYVQPTVPIATYAEATTAEVLGCEAGALPLVDPPGFLPGTTNPEQVAVYDGS